MIIKRLNYIKKNVILLFEVQKNTENKKQKVEGTKNGIITLLSKCSGCNIKKSKFTKEEEARGLLSSLE